MTASLSTYVAGNKFGLGLRPGERQLIASDPRNWLRQQLKDIARVPAAFSNVEPSDKLVLEAVQGLRKLKQGVDAVQAGKASSNQQTSDARAQQLRQQVIDGEKSIRQAQREQLMARLQHSFATETPFAERLVRFWSNHFTVAEGGGVKRALRVIAVPYENEAIRTRLNGNFADLLLAVEQHPAMQIYLDNFQSIGGDSRANRNGKRGLNENLAREILELHTLGVDGGYTQQDVTTLARIITGWTVGGIGPNPRLQANPGRFLYVDVMHEPGTQRLLGNSYRDNGVDQGKQALRDLAQHPATARHIAVKLARHFVADQPPPAAIDKLETTFRDTHGHLPSVHAALIELDAAWDENNRKLKTPEELVISLGRGLNLGSVMQGNQRNKGALLIQALTTFGQTPFSAPSPAGWSDLAEFWGNPDALLKRIEFATAVAERIPPEREVLAIYADLLPQQPKLVVEISRAATTSQALALLVASPQFQWR
ncbi:MAG TPA: DUF1800 family protein [Candidatus Acidoferrum sp.]|nr:DUF1800 family protein [Candidatus Acidoferrum sp.]